MAITKHYFDLISAKVGIAPAGSQEELDCAQTLSEAFTSRGLAPTVQEFSAPAWGKLSYGAVMALLTLGVVIVGVGGVPATLIGLVLSAGPLALLAMAYIGRDVLPQIGPRAKSQNVIAFHAAEGEGASRNRPIVILAHYDTQRLDPLAQSNLVGIKKYLAMAAPYTLCVVAACVLVQLLVFLPEAARRTFWVVGILASLPTLAWGVSLIVTRFGAYTEGGVDNKSSLAAMLGVLDRVCGGAVLPQQPAEGMASPEAAGPVSDGGAPGEPIMRREVEEVVGRRHGEAVIRELGILPEDCDITYIEPEVRMVPVEGAVLPAARANEGATAALTPLGDELTKEVAAAPAGESADASDPGATDSMEAMPAEDGATASVGAGEPEDGTQEPRPSQTVASGLGGSAGGDELAGAGQAAFAALDQPVGTGQPADAGHPATSEIPAQSQDASPNQDAARSASDTRPMEVASGEGADAEATKPMSVIAAAERVDASGVPSAESLSMLEDGESTDEGPLTDTDRSGLDTMVEEDAEEAALAERGERPHPAAIDDPSWGQSSYTPRKRADVSNVARRAALFDLPDPSQDDNDVLAMPSARASAPRAVVSRVPDPAAVPVVPAAASEAGQAAGGAEVLQLPPRSQMAQRLAEASERIVAGPDPTRIDADADATQFVPALSSADSERAVPKDIQVLSASTKPAGSSKPKKQRRGLAGLFGRKRRQQEESMSEWLGVDENFNAKESGEDIGSWDNFNEDDGLGSPRGSSWKGGAALNINLRGLKDKAAGMLGRIGGAAPEESQPLPDPNATIAVDAAGPEEGLPGGARINADFAPGANPDPGAAPDETAGAADAAAGEAPAGEGDAPNPYLDPAVTPADAAAAEPGLTAADPALQGAADEVPDMVTLRASGVNRELRDAILAMGDDDLRAHDIWFVATGASSLGHAGAQCFVDEYKKQLRGVFVINLDCVGAGRLSMLTREGFGRQRRADRRLARLIGSVADDLHLDFASFPRAWADTDATPLMRRSLRAVTLMGMGTGELPACSGTAADTAESVDAEQIEDVCALITEVIRRS